MYFQKIQTLKKSFLKVVGCSALLWIGQIAHAELSPLELKGVHELFAPEYEYLSPIYGFTLIGTHELVNRRFYGKYGPKKEGFGCLEEASRIHALLARNQDCPQDHTSEFIQRLFPSQDRVNFVTNQIESDPVSHLTSEMIGKVLGRIAQVKDADLTNYKSTEQLKIDLMALLSTDFDHRAYIKQRKKSLNTEMVNCQSEERGAINEKLNAFEELLKSLSSPGRTSPQSVASDSSSEEEQLGGRNLKSKWKQKESAIFADLMIAALKESRIQPAAYPRHLPEQALLALFWKNSNQKEDFLNLIGGMSVTHPGIVRHPEVLHNEAKKQAFLSDKYEASNFDKSFVLGDSKPVAADLLNHPEKLIFYAHQEVFATKPLPPIISYGSAKHPSLNGGTYPDCGETSLRNLFNIMIYKQGGQGESSKFDVSILEKNSSLKLNPGLITFYGKHTDPSLAVKQDPRDEWSEVVSGHEGGDYLKGGHPPKCEMNAGVDNMMTIVDRLIHSDQPQGGTPISQAKTRSEKLDALCKAFSREGLKLDWKVKHEDKSVNQNNTEVDIEFSINDEPKFIWQFMSGHFAIQALREEKDSWKSQVGEEMAKLLTKKTNPSKPLISPNPHLLNWFSDTKSFDQITSHFKDAPSGVSNPFQRMVYSLPLSSNDGKLFAFKDMATHPDAMKMRTLATRLMNALPIDDLYTQQQIHSALADNDYPFGDAPTHPIGKPEAIYTRVNEEQLGKHFGEVAAKKMGRSWARSMYGYSIAIGEPLSGETGHDLNLNFREAKEACLNLNDASHREKVENAFNSREAKFDQIRKASYTDETQREKALGDIHKNNPVQGCYLMSREEWGILEADFGYKERKYIPQILPKLYKRVFWSSLGNAKGDDCAFGSLIDFECVGVRTHMFTRTSVRCACSGGAVW